MSRFAVTLAALTALAACSAAAQPPDALMTSAAAPIVAPTEAVPAARFAVADEHSVDAPSCDIRVIHTANGVRLEPVAFAAAPGTDYQFTISKSGPSGASDISQGGAIEPNSGAATLGGAELSMQRGDRFHAVLTLHDNGAEICRRDLRS